MSLVVAEKGGAVCGRYHFRCLDARGEATGPLELVGIDTCAYDTGCSIVPSIRIARIIA